MNAQASAQDRRVGVSGYALTDDPRGMSDPKTWRDEYEKVLLDEALRRMKRLPPRDLRTWTLVAGMTRHERFVVLAWLRITRLAAWLRGRLRL